MARGIALCMALVVGACVGSASRGSEFRRHGGHVVLIDARTGAVNSAFLDTDNNVQASVADGRGGWFIAGGFRYVGHAPRPGLARLQSDGRLDPVFAPSLAGELGKLVRQGGTLWAVARHRGIVFAGAYPGVFAFDARSGKQLWAAHMTARNSGGVSALTYGNGVLYVIGGFTRIGSAHRNGIAALNPRSGKTLSWSVAVAPNSVGAVATAHGIVYIGGLFQLLGGRLRAGLAAVSARTGRVLPWAPATEVNGVGAIAVVGDEVLAGGDGGFNVVDARTGKPLAWRSGLRGVAKRFAVLGNTVYLGGDVADGFTATGSHSANNLAAVRLPAGRFTSWTPRVTHEMNVFTLSVSGHTVLAGGSFTHTLGGGP